MPQIAISVRTVTMSKGMNSHGIAKSATFRPSTMAAIAKETRNFRKLGFCGSGSDGWLSLVLVGC